MRSVGWLFLIGGLGYAHITNCRKLVKTVWPTWRHKWCGENQSYSHATTFLRRLGIGLFRAGFKGGGPQASHHWGASHQTAHFISC